MFKKWFPYFFVIPRYKIIPFILLMGLSVNAHATQKFHLTIANSLLDLGVKFWICGANQQGECEYFVDILPANDNLEVTTPTQNFSLWLFGDDGNKGRIWVVNGIPYCDRHYWYKQCMGIKLKPNKAYLEIYSWL